MSALFGGVGMSGSGSPMRRPHVSVAAVVEWAQNLPAGLTEQFDTQFSHPFPSNFGTHSDGWKILGGSANEGTAEPGADYTGDCFDSDFAEGTTGDGSGAGGLYTEAQTHRQIYLCTELWLDADYVVHYNEEKFFYPRTNNSVNNMVCDFIAPASSYGSYPGSFSTSDAEVADYWVFMVSPQTSGAARRFQPANGVYPNKGEWNLVEVYAQMNTQGNADGLLDIWLNGVSAFSLTDVTWSDAATDDSWDGLYVASTRGGGSALNAVPTGGQKRQYSRMAYHASSTRAA